MPSLHNFSEENLALLNDYEQFLSGKAEGTTEAYLRTARDLIQWVTEHSENREQFQPQLLTKTMVELYLEHLEQEGFSLNHRTRVKSSISTFAQYLIEEKGLLQRNPTRGIGLPLAPQSTPRLLSKEQRSILVRLVEQADDLRGTALFALGYWAGCRVSDVSWLQNNHTHVGPREGWLHLGYQGSRWRDIKLLRQARKPLYEYLQATNDIKRNYVFISKRDGRLTEQGIHYWFRTLKTQASQVECALIQDLTFHDLRTDFAHRVRDAGWSLNDVSDYLGLITPKGPLPTF